MKLNVGFGDVVSHETLIGIPRKEAIKFSARARDLSSTCRRPDLCSVFMMT